MFVELWKCVKTLEALSETAPLFVNSLTNGSTLSDEHPLGNTSGEHLLNVDIRLLNGNTSLG